MKNISFSYKRKKTSGLLIIFISYGFKDHIGKYQQLQLSTGIRVQDLEFDPKTGVGGKASLNLRLAIQKFETEILNKLYEASNSVKNLHTFPPSWIKEAYLKEKEKEQNIVKTLTQAVQSYIDHKNNDALNPISPVAINAYINLKNRIKEYGDIPIQLLTNDYIYKFSNHLIKSGLRVNTVLKYFSKLRTAALFNNPNIKLKLNLQEEMVDKVVFDLDELYQIEKFTFESERLNKIRNNFIFQAYTGLRYSDFMQNGEVIYLNNKPYIRILTQKTGAEVVIPLMKNVQKLIKEGKLNYSISNQKYNDYLKEVIEKIFPEKTIKIKFMLKGKQEVKIVTVHSLVSTHTGRRSFATNFYLLGFPIKLLMDILGQKSEDIFLRYIQSDKLKQAQTLNKLIGDLQKTNPKLAKRLI